MMTISLTLFYQYMAIFFNFSATSSHLHPLQVENCGSNSRLVVDEMTMVNSGSKGLMSSVCIVNERDQRNYHQIAFCLNKTTRDIMVIYVHIHVFTICFLSTCYEYISQLVTIIMISEARIFSEYLLFTTCFQI